MLGIELNPYAAELARVTVWIGEIQWMLTHGYALRRDPILAPLDHIECRDAILLNTPADNASKHSPLPQGEGQGEGELSASPQNSPSPPTPLPLGEGSEPLWPAVDTIVGNPPFLGGSKKRGELGDHYFNALNSVYADRVPGGADLVTYWFEKARAQIEAGKAQRAGLVATNSIRGGANRKVLERILDTTRIFEAWSDEPWINNGAAVRVSLVCFGHPASSLRGEAEAIQKKLDRHGPVALAMTAMLDGQPVTEIHADLTAGNETSGALDLTQAKPLAENAGVSFQGSQKIGAFDIPGGLARQWLGMPNPNGKPNSEVLKPSWNGLDVTRQPRDGWVIDFGTALSEAESALYETPFAYVLEHVRPEREKNNREAYRKIGGGMANHALLCALHWQECPAISPHQKYPSIVSSSG